MTGTQGAPAGGESGRRWRMGVLDVGTLNDATDGAALFISPRLRRTWRYGVPDPMASLEAFYVHRHADLPSLDNVALRRTQRVSLTELARHDRYGCLPRYAEAWHEARAAAVEAELARRQPQPQPAQPAQPAQRRNRLVFTS